MGGRMTLGQLFARTGLLLVLALAVHALGHTLEGLLW